VRVRRRDFEKEEKTEEYFWWEREAGKFVRTVQLPGAIDTTKIAATYQDGIMKPGGGRRLLGARERQLPGSPSPREAIRRAEPAACGIVRSSRTLTMVLMVALHHERPVPGAPAPAPGGRPG
jgi:hypothetical protein